VCGFKSECVARKVIGVSYIGEDRARVIFNGGETVQGNVGSADACNKAEPVGKGSQA
jgi:hypothetical protein